MTLGRLFGEREETVSHVESGERELTQNDYIKGWHNEVPVIFYWHMCQNYGFPTIATSYAHFVDKKWPS